MLRAAAFAARLLRLWRRRLMLTTLSVWRRRLLALVSL
jgi:hypothetical protein